MKKATLLAASLLLCLALPAIADDARVTVPDVALVDQHGKSARLPDLLRGKTAAVNFIFTSCTTICSPMGANFGALQAKLDDRKDVALLSISIDPSMDTPERLKTWSAKFKAQPGWTLLTGQPRDVETVLRAFGVYTGDRISHAPVVMIGNHASGKWTRANGLAPAAELLTMIDAAREKPATNHARNYFTDVQLVNQHGDTMRLYSDLMEGKTVVINSFFATCQAVCPALSKNFNDIQAHLGDRKDVTLISISLDPENDTPAKLREYAKRVGAKPGWYFLTGTKQNVDAALRKLGQYVDDKNSHFNVILIGNDRTGLWKKALGLAPAKELIPIVDSVVNDKG